MHDPRGGGFTYVGTTCLHVCSGGSRDGSSGYPMAESSGVVHRMAYVRQLFFKVYLLLKFESDLLETWYTCSLGEGARCAFGGSVLGCDGKTA